MCAVAKEAPKKGYRLIEAVVDSGAEESVAPPRLFPGRVVPSAMSRAGGRYKAANGTRIPNLGQQKVQFKTDEDHQCGMGFQVVDVGRPLIAVSQLAAAGNHVHLEAKGGKVVNDRTGRTMALHRKGGVRILRTWVASGSRDCPGQGR